jgi:hypothetical protein
MPRAWWHREPVTLEQLKPDVIPDLNGPLLRPTQLMEAVTRYKQKGVTLKAMARETGVHYATLYNYQMGKFLPGKPTLVKMSWLFRALDAGHVKFIEVRQNRHGAHHDWVLVKGNTYQNALVAKPTLGICACGRYESCPCGRFMGRSDADFDVAVQQYKVPSRVGHHKPGPKVPKVPK